LIELDKLNNKFYENTFDHLYKTKKTKNLHDIMSPLSQNHSQQQNIKEIEYFYELGISKFKYKN
jgi:hypothetical protein